MGGVDEASKVKGSEDEEFIGVLSEAIEIVESSGKDYVVGGSLATKTWGRPVSPGDVDLIVTPADAPSLLEAYGKAGFETKEEDPNWIFKASKGNTTVDLIFEMEGAHYLDDEMMERSTIVEHYGVRMRMMPPEDYVLSQALSMQEDTPDYWYNALVVLTKSEIDWDYLIQRAKVSPRRILSLLVFAQSNDLGIPNTPIRRLFESLYDS